MSALRFLGVLAVVVGVTAGCDVGTGTDAADPSPGGGPTTAAPTDPRTVAPTPTPTEEPTAEARRVLTDVVAAAASTPDDLRVAVATAMEADLSGLVVDDWEARVLEGLPTAPVHVGRATVGLDGRVDLDLVVAAPADADGDLVLRWLPAAPALGDAVDRLRVDVDGRQVDPEVDRTGARLAVPVPVDEAATVRVRARYRIPDRAAVVEDGTPAGYGLLSRTDETVMLGHWLPLVALPGDDGPMQARGDVGAFLPGAFSLVVEHEGTLVSGGEERDCPTPSPGCTWLQGVGLRDLAAVVLDDPAGDEARVASGTTVRARVPDGLLADTALVRATDQAAGAIDALEVLGPLPWPTVDIVAAPISPGALGMEFPGMVWVDPGAWPRGGPDLGAYVLAHEIGHQWFHALVGSGSLSAPVVDESLAQYLSVVVFDAMFGPGEGAALAARSLGGRHAAALAGGTPDEAPAQALADFASARSYGASVYGRGGQAWVDADLAAGRPPVVEALRVLVSRFGLREVDEQVVLDVVREVAPDAAGPLAEGWGLPGS